MLQHARKLALFFAVAAAAVAVVVPLPAQAGGTPCWRELINDWYDGRIDKTYPAHCYREAQKHVPKDAESYSSLPEDLSRALTAAVAGSDGRPPGPNTPIEPIAGLGRKEPSSPVPSGGGDDGGPEVLGGDDKSSGVLGYFAPANADSIPIPLLVLAGLAVLLLAAAVASYLARRRQLSRLAATAPAQTRRPPA